MGKGSNRRQFNKENELAFKKHYTQLYGRRERSSNPRTVYVMKGKDLISKDNRY